MRSYASLILTDLTSHSLSNSVLFKIPRFLLLCLRRRLHAADGRQELQGHRRVHRVRQPLQRRQVHQHARKLLLRLLRRSQDGPGRLLVLGSGRVLHQQGHLQVRFFTLC